MSKKKSLAPAFKAGDRVAERPKASMIPNLKAESLRAIAKYRTQRYGVVVDSYVKESKSRLNKITRSMIVRVIWDGSQTPSEHAQMRLCLESDFPQVMDGYCTAIGEGIDV